MFSIYLYTVWVKLIVMARNFVRKNAVPENVVIVKLDEIGDYILFRNFLEEIHKDYSTGDRKIILIGNLLWKDLSLFLDNQYIAEFIAINMKQKDDVGYLRKIIQQTSSLKADILINASYTRKPLSDIISFLVQAPNKFAFNNTTGGTGYSSWLRSKIYNNKVMLADFIVHEFRKNLFYFEQILQRKINLKRPHIPGTTGLLTDSKFKLPNSYMVLFIGGTDEGRKWPVKKFVELLASLKAQLTVVLVGSISESPAGNIIARNTFGSINVINLTGRTTLLEMFQVIKKASLVIGNESGVIHMADALDIPSVCILGGGHFNRFVPYPPGSHSRINPVFSHMACFNCDWLCIYKRAASSAYPCIDGISVKQVQKAAESLLN